MIKTTTLYTSFFLFLIITCNGQEKVEIPLPFEEPSYQSDQEYIRDKGMAVQFPINQAIKNIRRMIIKEGIWEYDKIRFQNAFESDFNREKK